MGTLDINNLTKNFSDSETKVVAVDNIDIEIADGEFLVLVGPSGCGKTTTLRCIGGLENPSEGDICLDNVSLLDSPPQSRDIAMVFQNYALYPHMTVRENMSFGLRMNSDLTSTEITERVEDATGMMGITELLEQKPGELSGGQQQRVALGRAIVREPEVFLMDEPLSNLDAKLRRQMRTEIQNLQHDLNTTTVYVTHDQTEAMTMGDSIAILNDGKLQQHGTPLECYHLPANRFVAGFIGSPSMNFIDCRQEGSGLNAAEFTYEISNELRSEIPDESDKLTIGIRPSDIVINNIDGSTITDVEVKVTEPLGDITYVYTTIDEKEFVISVDGEQTVRTGESINLFLPENKLHLFDQQTGETVRNRVPPEDEEELIKA